jgi:PAS domain S-box-containing protein
MSSKWTEPRSGSGVSADLARQIGDYMTRVGDLRARQRMLGGEAGFFDALYEEVSQGIEELRIAEEELRHRDREIYQAYAAVVRERRRYKDLFDLGPDAHLITDDLGVVLEANVRAEALLGLSVGHLRAKPIISLVSGKAQRRLFREWLSKTSFAHMSETLSLILQSSHREPFAAELSVARIAGETSDASVLLWTIVDVSQKLAARRDAELAAVVRVGGDAIVVLSTHGLVSAQNPASRRMHGDIVGRPMRDAIWGDREQEHLRTIAGLSTEAPVATIESVHLLAGGEPLDVSVTYSLIDEPAGSPRRVALGIRNISAQKQLESRLRELAAEREQSDRRKTEFIGLLAHELRNPLNVITTSMEVLRLTDDPSRREQVATSCLRNARHMARLIDELLDLSRISRDELEIAPRPAAIHEIVARAIELTSSSLEARGHHLRIQLPEKPVVVRADPTRMIQAISNLLDNAAKYTPSGGTITVSVQAGDGDVQISVQDNGTGIAPELIDRVFEPFIQAHEHRSTGGGLGIGLALVRRIAQLHGGGVRAESAGTGLGARFIISLPLDAQLESGIQELLANLPARAAGKDADNER